MTSLDDAFSKFFECQAKSQSVLSNAETKLKDSIKWLDNVLASAEALFVKPGPENETAEEAKDQSVSDEDVVPRLEQFLGQQRYVSIFIWLLAYAYFCINTQLAYICILVHMRKYATHAYLYFFQSPHNVYILYKRYSRSRQLGGLVPVF